MKELTKLSIAVACVASCAGLGAPAALADEASFLYDPGTVNAIEMTLPQAGIEGLESEPFQYQPGGTVVVTPTDGTPAGRGTPSKTFQNVEIKLKGKPQGSFEDLGHKAAFKLKFKKAESFFGLRKLTLNNMTQDPSMIHESLAYTAFAADDVPASRSGYANVWLNGENYGLHLNLESLDTISLPRIFGVPTFDSKTQHLYEANEYGADLYPGKESRFEVDEGEASTADLTALIAAVDAAAANPLPPGLSTLLDLEEMTRMWGAEKYIGHWDGYAGEGIRGEEEFNEHRPNNYYLYSDPSGRFQMLPWGTDQTWVRALEFDGQDGRLFDLCLEDESCSSMFSRAVADALGEVGSLDLDAQAAAMAAMLAPWQALEVAPRKPFDAGRIAGAVTSTREFIADRPAEAEAWLVEHPPPVDPPVDPPPDDLPPAVDPSPAGGGVRGAPSRAPTAARSPEPRPTLALLGVEKEEGRARLTIHVDGSGDVAFIGSSQLDGRRRRVCRDSAHAAADVVLVCRLSPRALQRLRRHALPILLHATFAPDAGGTDRFSHRIRLARLNPA